MAARETYLLHIYRSRAMRGWQWAARLEHLPDRESLRFSDPEALLAHLRTVLWAGDYADPPTDPATATDDPSTGPRG